MSHLKTLGYLMIASWLFFGSIAYSEEEISDNSPTANVQATPIQPVKPYRTFLTIQRYTIENNGEPNDPISNVRLELKFAKQSKEQGNSKVQLPGGGQYWPIGNGQVQEIGQTFEIPWEFLQSDGFTFEVQMVRKGAIFMPCKFEVQQMSQFNRTYICRLDTDWQTKIQRVPPDRLDKEALQVRVFTDLNSESKDVPKDAIALK